MGEIADLMINGDICEQCTVTLDGEGNGFPRLCGDCALDRRLAVCPRHRPGPKMKCPTCTRMVKAAGLADHNRAVHNAEVCGNDRR